MACLAERRQGRYTPLMTVLGFTVLPLFMIALLTALVWREGGARAGAAFVAVAAAWAGATYVAAASGFFRDFSFPPRMFIVLVGGLGLAGLCVTTSPGRALMKLPFSILVGLQAFRILVELLIHGAVLDGLAPPQMSWGGYNFDIVSGGSALVVAVAVTRLTKPRALVLAWNAGAVAILVVVIVVGVLSLPTPFQRLTPDNAWIADAPYVWLPSVLVMAALVLHAVCIRKALQPTNR